MVVGVPAVGRPGVDLSDLDTADRVAELRRRMAAMPGGGLSAADRSVPGAMTSGAAVLPSEGTGARPGVASPPADELELPVDAAVISAGQPVISGSEVVAASGPVAVPAVSNAAAQGVASQTAAALPGVAASVPTPAVPGVPVPESVAELLPRGVLPAGKVTAVAGSATLRVGLLAAATAAGVRCAVVGWPELGLAAVAEQGGRLDCLALIPDPGPDPAAVVSVLIDGLDLVLLGPDVATVAPSRARVLAGRVRSAGAVLLVGPGWPGAELTLAGRHCRYGGLGAGAGRLVSVSTLVRCSGRAAPARSAEWVAAG